jgi:hypothetical protein
VNYDLEIFIASDAAALEELRRRDIISPKQQLLLIKGVEVVRVEAWPIISANIRVGVNAGIAGDLVIRRSSVKELWPGDGWKTIHSPKDTSA